MTRDSSHFTDTTVSAFLERVKRRGVQIFEGKGFFLCLADATEIIDYDLYVDAIITDPVWPNHNGIFGDIDAFGVLRETLEKSNFDRLVIHMRNDSDPRFLEAVAEHYTFLQAMWLRFACVGHQGRFLTGNDVAYAFGHWPRSKPGRRSLPAMGPVEAKPVRNGHPSPRSLTHVQWLVNNWADGLVLDPFMGSGTTGVACLRAGVPFLGIESNPEYFEIALKRLEEANLQGQIDFTGEATARAEAAGFDFKKPRIIQ